MPTCVIQFSSAYSFDVAVALHGVTVNMNFEARELISPRTFIRSALVALVLIQLVTTTASSQEHLKTMTPSVADTATRTLFNDWKTLSPAMLGGADPGVTFFRDPSSDPNRWYYFPFKAVDWRRFSEDVNVACADSRGVKSVHLPVKLESHLLANQAKTILGADSVEPYPLKSLMVTEGDTTLYAATDIPVRRYSVDKDYRGIFLERDCQALKLLLERRNIGVRYSYDAAHIVRDSHSIAISLSAYELLKSDLDKKTNQIDVLRTRGSSAMIGGHVTALLTANGTVQGNVKETKIGTIKHRVVHMALNDFFLQDVINNASYYAWCQKNHSSCAKPTMDELTKAVERLGTVFDATVKQNRDRSWKLITDNFTYDLSDNAKSVIVKQLIDAEYKNDSRAKATVDSTAEADLENKVTLDDKGRLEYQRDGESNQPLTIKVLVLNDAFVESSLVKRVEAVDQMGTTVLDDKGTDLSEHFLFDSEGRITSDQINTVTAGCVTERRGGPANFHVSARGFACDQPIYVTLIGGIRDQWNGQSVQLCAAHDWECTSEPKDRDHPSGFITVTAHPDDVIVGLRYNVGGVPTILPLLKCKGQDLI